jgi:hypothetical protein
MPRIGRSNTSTSSSSTTPTSIQEMDASSLYAYSHALISHSSSSPHVNAASSARRQEVRDARGDVQAARLLFEHAVSNLRVRVARLRKGIEEAEAEGGTSSGGSTR